MNKFIKKHLDVYTVSGIFFKDVSPFKVMYMFYILKWALVNQYGKAGLQEAAENTYLLALDGDVDFEPEAVLSLMKRMNKSPLVGAVCGRIHPIGSGKGLHTCFV